MPIFQTEDYFENPWYCFVEEPILFLLAAELKLLTKRFPVLGQKPT